MDPFLGTTLHADRIYVIYLKNDLPIESKKRSNNIKISGLKSNIPARGRILRIGSETCS